MSANYIITIGHIKFMNKNNIIWIQFNYVNRPLTKLYTKKLDDSSEISLHLFLRSLLIRLKIYAYAISKSSGLTWYVHIL